MSQDYFPEPVPEEINVVLQFFLDIIKRLFKIKQ